MQITVGAKPYNVVDRKVKGVRLLQGPGGRVDRTMMHDEKLEAFEERTQALFDEAQQAPRAALRHMHTHAHTAESVLALLGLRTKASAARALPTPSARFWLVLAL